MEIIDILKASDKVKIQNLNLLADDYLKKTGKKVCKTCPSSVILMILELKNIYSMTNFRFKRVAAQYKNKKGDKTTISNATMTDERAIEFLKTDPSRIVLFSEFPENWEQLVAGEIEETKKQKAIRLEVEAEAAAAAGDKDLMREILMQQTLPTLREKYPDIKSTKKEDFVDKVLDFIV